MNNRERLIDLMIEHELERTELALMLKVKSDTIDHWLLPNEAGSHEEMPDMAIELLELKLDMQS
jgi:hypothetical protein